MWWQKYMVASLKDILVQYSTLMRGLLIPFLVILIQVSSCTLTVIGYIGQNVTLPCSYDVEASGVLSVCWGHGQVSLFKCSNTILSSDYGNVNFRESPRYQLLSQVTQGDVSLTIIKAQKTDSGVYGCRVEIPGWFNDQKNNVHLTIEEAPVEDIDIQSSTQAVTVTQAATVTVSKGSEIRTIQNATSQVNFSRHEIFKAFLKAQNIGRIAVIFFLTLILILILIFGRKVLMRRTTPQQLNTITAENIYDAL